jgi:hypothetical protein
MNKHMDRLLLTGINARGKMHMATAARLDFALRGTGAPLKAPNADVKRGGDVPRGLLGGNGDFLSALAEWNRRLDVVRTLVISAAMGYRNGLGLYGPPGVGKSHIVQQTLKDIGKKWEEAPKGLTPQGLLEFFQQYGSGIMLFDDVAELFGKERARKYMMAAFGTRPDYTQPRLVPYARQGQQMNVTVTGCCIILTNEERLPAAFSSRITVLEYAPTQEQLAALMRDIAGRGMKREKWELCARECTEVAEFLIPEATALGVPLDLRDLVEKSLPDYALWKAGLSRVDWRDLVRAHLLGKISELKHTPPPPLSRAHRLEKERAIVQEILRLFPQSRAEQLDAWRGALPDAGVQVTRMLWKSSGSWAVSHMSEGTAKGVSNGLDEPHPSVAANPGEIGIYELRVELAQLGQPVDVAARRPNFTLENLQTLSYTEGHHEQTKNRRCGCCVDFADRRHRLGVQGSL